ncbi:MAG: bifunctional riboflavin kinase/FAD synthetase [Pseudorhodobacter sp.]
MRIYQNWHGIAENDRGGSLAMGNFDGVHIGHRHVIDLAHSKGRPGIVTFEPHPRSFFAPDAPPFRLMNAEARANRLAKLGIEVLFELPFNAHLADFTPEAFVDEVLHKGIGAAHVTVGTDFQFGRKRAGNVTDLKRLCSARGIGVTVADLIHSDGVEVSSTQIRSALAEGQPERAQSMLGHWHRIEGAVIHGAKRGRELGFPTANMRVDNLHLPKPGVYAVLADVLTGPHKGHYKGAANLGVRPMFGDNKPNLETYIFDFSGDLYGEHLSIAFVGYLRAEETFDGLPALIRQMQIDCDRARQLLETV